MSNDCAAHGCPMLGSLTTSTTGAQQWWCFCHHGNSATHFQAITAELNRMHWLVGITKDIRLYRGTADWHDVYRKLNHALAMNLRHDLQCQKGESVTAWLIRLEGVLLATCQPSAPVPLIEKAKEAAGLKRLEMPVPEHA